MLLKNKSSFYFSAILFFATAFWGEIGVESRALAQQLPKIQLSASTDQAQYVPRQPVVVSMRIVNLGNSEVTVPEPSPIALVVTFDISTSEGGRERVISSQVLGAGPPGWSASMVTLPPGKSSSSSGELFALTGEMSLPQGQYGIRARYHLGEYGSADYQKNFVEAKCQLNIVAPNETQKKSLSILLEARGIGQPSARKSALYQWLRDNLKSEYRVSALDDLLQQEYEDQDWKALVSICQMEISEPISTTKREKMLYQEALAMVELKDIPGAIKVLQNSNMSKNVGLRQQLELKLKG